MVYPAPDTSPRCAPRPKTKDQRPKTKEKPAGVKAHSFLDRLAQPVE
jgi:hypothetical protein